MSDEERDREHPESKATQQPWCVLLVGCGTEIDYETLDRLFGYFFFNRTTLTEEVVASLFKITSYVDA